MHLAAARRRGTGHVHRLGLHTKNLNACALSLRAEEELDVPYQEVKDVVTVGRGLGFWGDMVVTLRNNDKVELRSLPQCAPPPPCRVRCRV